MNGDVRSENGLGSRGLEKEVALGTGEREEEANIPLGAYDGRSIHGVRIARREVITMAKVR